MPAEPINLFDFEAMAEGRMVKAEWDYVAGGATDEITLRRTRSAFDSIALRPRMLTGTNAVDLSTTVLGTRISVPYMMAPSGTHGRAHPDGELATARAAANFGTIMSMSANSSYRLEDVAESVDGTRWFQCYFYRNRETTVEMIRRAEEAGYTALVMTLDASWPSKRERNIRNDYRSRPRPELHPTADTGRHRGQPRQVRLRAELARTDRPRRHLGGRRLAQTVTDLPVVFKGIMTAEDAALCGEYGVDALIVSNHGARNLDTTLSTIETLPEVVDAAGDSIEVYLDGGIRRGSDVVKALALGARAVLFGRPIFWGLAYDGADGLTGVLEILRDEMESTMMLSGRPDVASLDATLVRQMPALE